MIGLKAYPACLVAYLCFVCMVATPIDNWHFSGNNIALHKSASQLPETYFDKDGIHKHYPASLAVDGNTDGYFKHGHCSHTIGKSYVDSSWTVNLGKHYSITGIIIYNRDDVKIRLKNFKVIGDDHTLIHDSAGTEEYKLANISIALDGLRTFSKITVMLPSGNGYSDGGNYYLTLCEVQIYAAPRPACDIVGTFITNGQTNIYHNTGRAIDGRYTVGTIIEVTCLDNFHPSGPSRLTCLPTDKYDYPIPKCEEVCAPIFTPSNGYLVPDQLLYLVNASLKIVCDKGYETERANIIQCQSGGRWESPIPTCHRVECALPNNPINGYYSVDGHTAIRGETSSSKLPYMTEITGICEAGYENIYPQKRICKSDKTWSDHEAICTPVECSYHGNKTHDKVCIPKMCNWPLRLKNGFYTASNDPSPYGMQYNTLLNATCNDGYKLSDNYNDRRCNADAVWDKTPAICYPMCVLPEVTNGKLISALSTNFVVGTTLRFTCNPGFIAESIGDTITCQENHRWTTAPACQEKMCILPVVNNGTFMNTSSKNFVVGTTLRFTCNPGFTAESLGYTITCQKNHKWTTVPVCHEKMCVLPVVTNGKFINTSSPNVVAGTILRFTCNTGFTAKSLRNTITCQKNSTWSAVPVCQEKMCVLPVVTNGKFINTSSSNVVVGTTLRFTCSPGFTTESLQDTIICQTNNTWSTVPVCQEKSEASSSVVIYIVVAVAVVVTVFIISAVVIFIFKRLHNTAQSRDTSRECFVYQDSLSSSNNFTGIHRY